MKITFAGLEVEITRKCQLKCAHCIRGDAQELDMSRETIDSLLDKTNCIYMLRFTGGEPFLNIDGMRYFLEGIKKRRILLSGLQIITNGLVRTDEAICLIGDYSAYIRQFVKPEIDIRYAVQIGISNDSFHKTDHKMAYEWYGENLSNVAHISENMSGERPLGIGRASELPYSIKITPSQFQGNKISYIAPGHEPLCPERKLYQNLFDGQVTILCSIYVTQKGKLISQIFGRSDYESMDNCDGICNVSVNAAEDIIAAIELYNKDKPYCFEPAANEIIKTDIVSEINNHPDPERHKRAVYANALLGVFGPYGLLERVNKLLDDKENPMTVEELFQLIGVIPGLLPSSVDQYITENRITPEEMSEMQIKALSERYGDYAARLQDAECRMKQKVSEMLVKWIEVIIKNYQDAFNSAFCEAFGEDYKLEETAQKLNMTREELDFIFNPGCEKWFPADIMSGFTSSNLTCVYLMLQAIDGDKKLIELGRTEFQISYQKDLDTLENYLNDCAKERFIERKTKVTPVFIAIGKELIEELQKHTEELQKQAEEAIRKENDFSVYGDLQEEMQKYKSLPKEWRDKLYLLMKTYQSSTDEERQTAINSFLNNLKRKWGN